MIRSWIFGRFKSIMVDRRLLRIVDRSGEIVLMCTAYQVRIGGKKNPSPPPSENPSPDQMQHGPF